MTDFRALCAELLQELEHATDWGYQQALKDQARAALAEPQPEPDHPDYFLAWILFAGDGKLRPQAQRVLAAYGIAQPEPEVPTDEELLETAADAVGYEHVPTDETCLSLARAVLARWGK